MDTFTDLFFPSTLGQEASTPRDASFPASAWVAPAFSDVRHAQHGVPFGFAEDFHCGMIMPAAAEGAPYDPIVRGHGPPGQVVSVIQ
eukprot:COSAG05_NODE_2730_length_2720_cov_7.164060_2_plen_87_part_00